MSDTTWGIMIQQMGGLYNVSSLADDSLYDGVREKGHEHGIYFMAGKKGITDENIDRIAKEFNGVVKRLNRNETFDFKRALEAIVDNPDIQVSRPLPVTTKFWEPSPK